MKVRKRVAPAEQSFDVSQLNTTFDVVAVANQVENQEEKRRGHSKTGGILRHSLCRVGRVFNLQPAASSTSSPSALPPSRDSPFLRLSTEIRLRIYQLVMQPSLKNDALCTLDFRPRCDLSLLLTCRKIYLEACLVCLDFSHLSCDTSTAVTFLHKLRPWQRKIAQLNIVLTPWKQQRSHSVLIHWILYLREQRRFSKLVQYCENHELGISAVELWCVDQDYGDVRSLPWGGFITLSALSRLPITPPQWFMSMRRETERWIFPPVLLTDVSSSRRHCYLLRPVKFDFNACEPVEAIPQDGDDIDVSVTPTHAKTQTRPGIIIVIPLYGFDDFVEHPMRRARADTPTDNLNLLKVFFKDCKL